MTAYWCDHAWLGGETAAGRVLLTVDGDRLTAVAAGVERPDGAVHLRGLTLPGLVDAHSHAFHRALRGRTHGGAGDFWSWRASMYQVAARLDPETLYDLAAGAFAELLGAGITTVGEFHYLHHGSDGRRYDDPNAMGLALIAAAQAVGIRLTLLDTCYLAGAPGVALAGTQLRFGDDSAEGWMERVDRLRDQPGACIGAAIHSMRAVDPGVAEQVSAYAAQRSMPLHVHLSEQPAENAACLAAFGATPARLLADAGALGPTTTAVHATHLTAEDITLLGGSGTSICLCPTTERDLADGVGPAAELGAAGSPLCLGTDSHAVVDLFEEARAVELDERLVTLRRGIHRPAALLEAATTAGARSLGWSQTGLLSVGRLADLCTVRLDTPRTAGVPAGPAALFAATAADVGDVVVGGRQLVSEGQPMRVRPGERLAHAIEAAWR